MAAAKVLGLARDNTGLSNFRVSPPPVPVDQKQWRHDCRDQVKWRCVWCEDTYCFECDTGEKICMEAYPNLRLCNKHYNELPRSASTTALTDYKPNALSSLKTQFIDFRQLARRSVKAVKGGKTDSTNNSNPQITSKSKEDRAICCCFGPRTLICQNCVPYAIGWKMQQVERVDQEDFLVCAFCRFPGDCKALENQSCNCNGRGVNCDYIDDDTWQKMEEDDLHWLGRATEDGSKGSLPLSKKDKKDLRSVFGDNFPYRNADHEKSSDRLPKRLLPQATPLPKPSGAGSLRKRLKAGVSRLRTTRSAYFASNATKAIASVPKRSLSVLSKASSVKSEAFNSQIESSRQSSMFLQNPQFRKPYHNVRISKGDLPPHLQLPNKFPNGRSYLDLDTDSNYEDETQLSNLFQMNNTETPSPTQQIINPELDFITCPPDIGSDDASSIASSPSFTFSDAYDSFEEENHNYHMALAPPPPIKPTTIDNIKVTTATVTNCDLNPPRIIEMRSSPNLKCRFDDGDGECEGVNIIEHGGCGSQGLKISGLASADTEMLYKNIDAVVSEKEIDIQVHPVEENNCSGSNYGNGCAKKSSKWGCSNSVYMAEIDKNGKERHAFWRCSFCDGKIKGI